MRTKRIRVRSGVSLRVADVLWLDRILSDEAMDTMVTDERRRRIEHTRRQLRSALEKCRGSSVKLGIRQSDQLLQELGSLMCWFRDLAHDSVGGK